MATADATPLMPHATAAWLVDNTGLTFAQIAEYCGIHILEVQAIADETAATKYTGRDPVRAHELSMEEIEKGQNDPNYKLKMSKQAQDTIRRTRGPRYTPLSKRQDRPAAILWLVKFHPELSDGAIGKLVGTTKPTIASIRERTHWNIQNIQAIDPVALGLCRQSELDTAVQAAVRLDGQGQQIFHVLPPVLGMHGSERPARRCARDPWRRSGRLNWGFYPGYLARGWSGRRGYWRQIPSAALRLTATNALKS